MTRAPYHSSVADASDVLAEMWEVLYDCSDELRNTRPTDPKKINERISQAIDEAFAEKIRSPEFIRLEKKLAALTAEYGEGLSQYAISRGLAHVLDVAETQECNGRFIRHADEALTSTANRILTETHKDLGTFEILSKQFENQWSGRVANGMRPPVGTHKMLITAATAVGLGLIWHGSYLMLNNDSKHNARANTETEKQHKGSQIQQNLVAGAEIAAGIGIGKWALTGKLLPGIHKLHALR